MFYRIPSCQLFILYIIIIYIYICVTYSSLHLECLDLDSNFDSTVHRRAGLHSERAGPQCLMFTLKSGHMYQGCNVCPPAMEKAKA